MRKITQSFRLFYRSETRLSFEPVDNTCKTDVFFFPARTGAVPIAENEQEDRVRVTGSQIRVGHVVRDVRRAPAVRQAVGRRFPSVRRVQAGRCGPVVGRPRAAAAVVVVRGLRVAPVARQTTRVGRDGRGTGPRRRRVRPVGRDPRGLAARGRGHRQEASARRRRRSVSRTGYN